MRVITGSARGVPLAAPRGGGTRPTSDLLKGAIFAALGDRGCAGRVLDLYAGSGALGIEALSRGADDATFVEANRGACRVIHANLRKCRLDDRARVLHMPVARGLDVLTHPFDLVILDPPYDDTRLDAVLERLGNSPLLAAGATMVVEHAAARPVAAAYGAAQVEKTRRHGDSAFSIYQVPSS